MVHTSPATYVRKELGLPSLQWVCDHIGKHISTVERWWADNPNLFKCATEGAAAHYYRTHPSAKRPESECK